MMGREGCAGAFSVWVSAPCSVGTVSKSACFGPLGATAFEGRRVMHAHAIRAQKASAARTTRAARKSVVSMDAAPQAQQVEPRSVVGVLFNIALFSAFFASLMGIVRRAAMEITLPHERIILVALAVILPDLARFSFTSLTNSPQALQKASNPEHVSQDDFPQHYKTCLFSTAVKLAGYVTAAVAKVTVGAFLVVLGQLIVNSMVQLKVVNGTIFTLKQKDRKGVILLELLSLIMLGSASFGYFPIMSSALFLSLVTVYWLAKYDVDLFGN
uniref:Uncharacterized protein n=1 Tax=Erythrolobus madagascarensis TaxID=708628 RepID=A0A7S0T7D9_9RHOD|mmetsp:Transcript_3758/g.8279  ORF Transcript_3758/g.8279 Transcript_3758/m.8279 type:complete len:271 (+) Transcript_3758:270-1082(+)